MADHGPMDLPVTEPEYREHLIQDHHTDPADLMDGLNLLRNQHRGVHLADIGAGSAHHFASAVDLIQRGTVTGRMLHFDSSFVREESRDPRVLSARWEELKHKVRVQRDLSLSNSSRALALSQVLELMTSLEEGHD